MKRKSQHLGEQLPPVKMFLDELEEIVRVLGEGGRTVTIEAHEHQFDRLRSLTELRRAELNDVELSIREPYVGIHFEPNQIWLYAASDDALSRGMFEAVKAIAQKRRRRFAKLLHSLSLAGGMVGIGISAGVISVKSGSFRMALLFLGLLIVGLAWSGFGYFDWRKRYSRVIPEYRIVRPGFIARNADRLAVAIISAALGALITYLVD